MCAYILCVGRSKLVLWEENVEGEKCMKIGADFIFHVLACWNDRTQEVLLYLLYYMKM